MRKLIVFDLDGVLVDSCRIHFEALNQALREVVGREISIEDHETIYNGLSTRTKLLRMGIEGDAVYNRKQQLTSEAFEELEPCERLIHMMRGLRDMGFRLACASNCIRPTVVSVLKKLGILNLFDVVFSNDDVSCPKPDPEIYVRVMEAMGVSPDETIIFEDSYVGLRAAVASRAAVHRVSNPSDLTFEYVQDARPILPIT